MVSQMLDAEPEEEPDSPPITAASPPRAENDPLQPPMQANVWPATSSISNDTYQYRTSDIPDIPDRNQPIFTSFAPRGAPTIPSPEKGGRQGWQHQDSFLLPISPTILADLNTNSVPPIVPLNDEPNPRGEPRLDKGKGRETPAISLSTGTSPPVVSSDDEPNLRDESRLDKGKGRENPASSSEYQWGANEQRYQYFAFTGRDEPRQGRGGEKVESSSGNQGEANEQRYLYLTFTFAVPDAS